MPQKNKTVRDYLRGYTPHLKPLPQVGLLCCEKCTAPLDFVWVNTGTEILCIGCFEQLYPRHAAVNRLKQAGEQLELPL